MPLNSQQMAALVERAKAKAPRAPAPAPASAPQRPLQAAPEPQDHSGASMHASDSIQGIAVSMLACARAEPLLALRPAAGAAVQPSKQALETFPAATIPPSAEPDDFPIGWSLNKESWHFHRRFYRVFRRPMRQGEYTYLLRQIWQHRGEHLGEHYWRVTLPDNRTTLVVTATRWRLITILPKGWQPTPVGGLSPPAPQTEAVPPP